MLLKTLIYYINGLSALHKQPLKSSQTNNDSLVDNQWTQKFSLRKNHVKIKSWLDKYNNMKSVIIFNKIMNEDTVSVGKFCPFQYQPKLEMTQYR